MAFYNLRERSNSKDLTDFSIYYYSENGKDYHLKYSFSVDFYQVYHFAKNLKDGDKFVEELDLLRCSLYDFIFNNVSNNKIKYLYTEEELGDEYPAKYDKDLKIIYDWFLPKQKEFAKKWNLYINVD